VSASASEAQASAADLENVRLSVQAELAFDYYELRSFDAQKQLFDSTVVAYKQELDLTQVRFQTGIASDEDVAQAETQLETAQAQPLTSASSVLNSNTRSPFWPVSRPQHSRFPSRR